MVFCLGLVFLLARGGAVWYVVPCCPQLVTHHKQKFFQSQA